MLNKTNWIAILVAALAGMVVGFLWYGLLFTNQWMAGNDIVEEGDKIFRNGKELSQSMAPMAINLVVMGVFAFLLNWLQSSMGVSTWGGGARVGAIVGLIAGLASTLSLLFAQRNSLIVVDGLYPIVLLTVIGAVVGGWRRR